MREMIETAIFYEDLENGERAWQQDQQQKEIEKLQAEVEYLRSRLFHYERGHLNSCVPPGSYDHVDPMNQSLMNQSFCLSDPAGFESEYVHMKIDRANLLAALDSQNHAIEWYEKRLKNLEKASSGSDVPGGSSRGSSGIFSGRANESKSISAVARGQERERGNGNKRNSESEPPKKIPGPPGTKERTNKSTADQGPILLREKDNDGQQMNMKLNEPVRSTSCLGEKISLGGNNPGTLTADKRFPSSRRTLFLPYQIAPKKDDDLHKEFEKTSLERENKTDVYRETRKRLQHFLKPFWSSSISKTAKPKAKKDKEGIEGAELVGKNGAV